MKQSEEDAGRRGSATTATPSVFISYLISAVMWNWDTKERARGPGEEEDGS